MSRLYGGPGMINGLRIIDNEMIGDPYEDWSGVRSRSRAERRRRQGHPQRVVTRYSPNGTCLHDVNMNCVFMHPIDRMRLEREIARSDGA